MPRLLNEPTKGEISQYDHGPHQGKDREPRFRFVGPAAFWKKHRVTVDGHD